MARASAEGVGGACVRCDVTCSSKIVSDRLMGQAIMAHLFEAHINVTNLDRSIAFYRDVVGLGLAHVSKERRAAFLWIGRPELSMLGLWSASESPNIMQVHVAICLELEAVLMSCAAWQSEGCERQCKSALFWRHGLGWQSASTMEHPGALSSSSSFAARCGEGYSINLGRLKMQPQRSIGTSRRWSTCGAG